MNANETEYRIVFADKPLSPDPCGRFETMGQAGARIRELGLQGKCVVRRERGER